MEQTPVPEDLPPNGPFAYFADPIFLSVPYPSWVRLDTSSHRLPLPWRSRHERPVLVAASFGTRSKAIRHINGSMVAHPLGALRQRLHQLCVAGHDSGCRHGFWRAWRVLK